MGNAKPDDMMTLYELTHRAHQSEVSEIQVLKATEEDTGRWIVAAKVNGRRIHVCTADGLIKVYKRVQSLIMRLENSMPSSVVIKLQTRGCSRRRVFNVARQSDRLQA